MKFAPSFRAWLMLTLALQTCLATPGVVPAHPGLSAAPRDGTSVTNQPWPGILIHSETRANPPTRIFVAEVALNNPKLRLRVARGGADPDGAGPWQTTLLEPTKIAAREQFKFVVNGDFFRAQDVYDGEGTNAAFAAGQWGLVEGPAMTDGHGWSTSRQPRPCLVIDTNQSVAIELLAAPGPDHWEVVGGDMLLVKDGVSVAPPAKERHPRTAIGLNAAGDKLIIVLVDGRKRGVAVGMTRQELAAEMVRKGCTQALNLDGGGSSVMAVQDAKSGEIKPLNQPTDGRERAVANVLGITFD